MRTATICPGPCNTAWRRAEEVAADTGTEHHITPAWGQPVQCDSCVERARRQLGELPALLAAVHLEAIHGSRSPSTATHRLALQSLKPRSPGRPRSSSSR
jgi:hypothetical protein